MTNKIEMKLRQEGNSQRIKWTINEKYERTKKGSHDLCKSCPILNWNRENVLNSEITSKESSK